jgi:hypothetical protein
MGFKRPFDDEEFQDLPFKQARQVECCNKLTQLSETGAHCNVPKKPDVAGKNCGLELHFLFVYNCNMVFCSPFEIICWLIWLYISFHVKQMAMGATFSKFSGMRHLRMT